jgi:hypothetical protein
VHALSSSTVHVVTAAACKASLSLRLSPVRTAIVSDSTCACAAGLCRRSFKDENNIALIQEILLVQSGEQAGEMFDGMVIAGADLLLIAALLSLKTHMAMKRSSDETELIMMTCFVRTLKLPRFALCSLRLSLQVTCT